MCWSDLVISFDHYESAKNINQWKSVNKKQQRLVLLDFHHVVFGAGMD